MRSKAAAAVIATTALSLGATTAAPAHEGHGSCKAAGQFAAGLAQELGSDFGQGAASFGRLGQADDFVASVHADLCAPRP